MLNFHQRPQLPPVLTSCNGLNIRQMMRPIRTSGIEIPLRQIFLCVILHGFQKILDRLIESFEFGRQIQLGTVSTILPLVPGHQYGKSSLGNQDSKLFSAFFCFHNPNSLSPNPSRSERSSSKTRLPQSTCFKLHVSIMPATVGESRR